MKTRLTTLSLLLALLASAALAQTQGGDPPQTTGQTTTGQNGFNFNFKKAKKPFRSGRIAAVDGHGTLMLTLSKSEMATVGDYYEIRRSDPGYDVKDKAGKVLKRGFVPIGVAQVKNAGKGKKGTVELTVVRKVDGERDAAIDDVLVCLASPPSNGNAPSSNTLPPVGGPS